LNRLTERFITPGVALACIAATAAAVIKVVAADASRPCGSR